jgi:putative ABC transport system permease protein
VLFHNLRIAWKSLKRNAPLTVLIVSGIALGIALATTSAAARHAFARNPIPSKSDVLHYVRIDNWDPLRPYPGPDPTQPPTQISYRDMRGIMRSTIPARQTGSFKAGMYVYPDPKVGRPFRENVRLVFSDFFPMFEVPFRHGTGWGRTADDAPEPVTVLSAEMNDKLFGGANSVGKTVRIASRDFRVVGVLEEWRPGVKFYDITQNFIEPPENIFIPFNLVEPMEIQTSGNTDGWGPSTGVPGFAGFLQAEVNWIQMWVELPTPEKVAEYEDFLRSYVLEQKKAGRLPRPVNNRVTPLMGWLKEQRVVPRQTTTLFIVSLLFLAVCALNLVGLLLGKFLARANEVGVRRALGATRGDIFLQYIIECELVGVLGGLLGLALSFGGIAALNGWLKTVAQRGDFFRLDGPMILLSVSLSLLAALAAGVYPAWRTSRLAPASHLRLQ